MWLFALQVLILIRVTSFENVHVKNIEIFSDLCREIKKTGAAGTHMMSVAFEWIAPLILERAGIKELVVISAQEVILLQV